MRSDAPLKPLTKPYLERVATWYLETYGGNEGRLRAALKRRFLKREVTDQAEAEAWVEEVVSAARQAGYVDDAAWAQAKARKWLSQGLALHLIRQRLRAEGLASALVQATLEELSETHPNPDLEGARNQVRRRRLGPYRQPEDRAAMRQKDLAALARRGYSFAIATQVLDEDIDAHD